MQVVFFFTTVLLSSATAYRTWKCSDGKCTKHSTDSVKESISVQECKLTCLPYYGLWPAPTGDLNVSSELLEVSTKSVLFTVSPELSPDLKKVLNEAQDVFLSRVADDEENTDFTHKLVVQIRLSDPNTVYYTYAADEKYELEISTKEDKSITATITAFSFLGARHGLETLAQLIPYDDIHKRHIIPRNARITDKPTYKHRGVSIDTARTYIPIDTLLGVIDAMAMNKLNSLHWHMTDTHSFPYVSTAYPIMSAEGAYSDKEVYTPTDIKRIVDYARVRGVRVTPELDAPAHVGEGWDALAPELITCFRWEPWTKYCVEPPCGQFDPTKDRVYDILHTIYQEWAALFPSDLFHMGGDEININCWNSTASITQWMTANNYSLDQAGFLKLWGMYQTKSYDQLRSTNPKATALLWTNTLTEQPDVAEHLDNSIYAIQVWTTRTDASIAKLVNQRFRLIFSNYDELYFDCGGAAWIGGPGSNWCSPYVGWQSVYNHDPAAIIRQLGVDVNESVQELLLGSEAVLWTEQQDGGSVSTRLWPRGAALAERLWTAPSWQWADAQYRINNQRDRMARLGVRAEQLQPTWCYHNDGNCGPGV